MPIKWFNASHRIQESILLCENLSDAHTLFLIARTAITAIRVYFPMAINKRNGGGSQLGKTLQSIASEERLCLCIVDSDRASPLSAVGNTARTVAPFTNTTHYPILQVYETPGRDLENTLHERYYSAHFQATGTVNQVTSLISHFTSIGDHKGKLFLDIEKGLRYRTFLDQASCRHAIQFWSIRFQSVCQAVAFQPDNLACYSLKTCSIPSHQGPCSCVVLHGNTADILAHFSAHYDGRSPSSLVTELTREELAEWIEIGLLVASWCCADQPQRS